MITALIVDDEPLTCSSLREALEAHGVSVLGQTLNGARALQLAADLCPDLILIDLDSRMPGLTGLQVGAALQGFDPIPLIVFISNGHEHAVTAFEQGVLDYLVKPVAPERLAITVDRMRSRLIDRRARRPAPRRAPEPDAPAPRRRVPVWTHSAVRLIRIEEIDCVQSREKLVYVRTQEEEYRTTCSLGQLEALLPSDQFFRIHTSHLVRLDRVEELLFLGNHRYAVRLSDNRVVPVGRSRYPALRHRLGLERITNLEESPPVDEPEEAFFRPASPGLLVP